jgi:hypothetical protein
VFLWSIYIPVALPVVATTSVAALIYVSTAILPLIFEHCPYTTASSRLIGLWFKTAQSWFKNAHVFIRPRYSNLKRQTLSGDDSPWQKAKRCINRKWPWQKRAREYVNTSIVTGVSYTKQRCTSAASHFIQSYTRARKNILPQSLEPQTSALVPIVIPFADPKSLMANGEVPMDLVSSEMIAWLLANCEDPKYLAVVIQSLAGADPWLPRLPLLENGVLLHIYQCLDGCFERENTFRLKSLVSPDLACLYVRGLNFMLAYHNYGGFYSSGGWIRSVVENTWHRQFDTGLTALALRKAMGDQWYTYCQLQYDLRLTVSSVQHQAILRCA